MGAIKSIFADDTEIKAEVSDVPEYEGLILVERALINNYMPVQERAVLRSIIHPETWKERCFDDRLCRKARFDPDLKFETRIRGEEVRFECLLELKNLLEMTILVIKGMTLNSLKAKAVEEHRQRLERDAQELSVWWGGLSNHEREMGLRGVLLSLEISSKEMDKLWEDADLETKVRLLGMAMHALESKPRKLAKDVRASQTSAEPDKKQRGRRGHLRLITEAA